MDSWSAITLLWTAQHSRPYSFLSRSLLREVCLYFPSVPSHLVHLHFHFLRFFDFTSLRWRRKVPLSKAISVDSGSRWVLDAREGLVCCGGMDWERALNAAYRIEKQGRVEEVGVMGNARGNHGIIEWNGCILVFGGCNSYIVSPATLNTCEELPGQQWSWHPLPSMRYCSAHFNPCLYRRLIYVGSARLEAFDPANRCFTTTSLRLPESYPCLLFPHQGYLVVKSLNFTVKYRTLPTGELVEVEKSRKCEERDRQHSSQPVVHSIQRVVYYVAAGACVSIDLDTGKTLLLH